MSDSKEAGPRILQPPSWPRPRGYANGLVAAGETIFLAGQIGWDTSGALQHGLVAQVRQALQNVVAVLRAGEAEPRHLVRMTWYVVDREDYLAA